ncbi:MAG TPA: saccharopine dehydrogenase C-terminal domain-containing protein [Patescibacteria group bacterium]|nr:saccharopine dehydrogenase C-terminal domain-containing protein [Patescibacteria group bacterium]
MSTAEIHKKGVIFGAGRVGSFCAHNLAEDGHDVLVVDSSLENLTRIQGRCDVRIAQADLSDRSSVARYAEQAEFAMAAVPGGIGFSVFQAMVGAGVPMVVDISFSPEDARTMNSVAQERNVTAGVQVGIGPGMPEVLAAHEYSKGMTIEKLTCMTGCLPIRRDNPPHHIASFNPADTLRLYFDPADYVYDGQTVFADDPFTEYVRHDIPGVGPMVGVLTAGLKTLSELPGLREAREVTYRDPRHVALMRSMYEMGLFSEDPICVSGSTVVPRDFMLKILAKHWLPRPNEDDVTVLRLELEGKKDDADTQVVYEMVDRNADGYSSLARTTAAAALSVLHVMINGMLNGPGILTPTDIGLQREVVSAMIKHHKNRNGITYARSERAK